MSKFTEVGCMVLTPLAVYFYATSAKAVNIYGFIILLVGFVFYLRAKISVIQKGVYFSFGCDKMSERMMWLYFSGFMFMGIGYFWTFVFSDFLRPF